ncbi:N-acetylmannosamine-6-phosphate 2-epimerase [Cohnella faecalis]|nr:N-acetylmannosamine-6-phosphate 2-epimerase [Cohnella faecalis]
MKTMFKQKGLIVSCQAFEGDPLYGDGVMAKMAKAAEQSGAVGIRACGADDILSIKETVNLPIIGLTKRNVPGSQIYITPELSDVMEILAAGAHIVALDMTDREDRLLQVVKWIDYIHTRNAWVMADISTYDEGRKAEQLGVDLISTTLSGYTPYSPQQVKPDIDLVQRLSESCAIPIVAEGRISNPHEAKEAMEAGADYVVVGSAITRPQLIVKQFVDQLITAE